MKTLKTFEIIENFGSIDWDVYYELDDNGEEDSSQSYIKIDNLFIEKDYRCKGNARKLILRAIEIIKKETGICESEIKIVAETKDNSTDISRLIEFYENLGLDVIAV